MSAVYRHPRPYSDCPLTACCASPTESNRPPATCHHLCAFLDMRRLPALISLHLPTLITMHLGDGDGVLGWFEEYARHLAQVRACLPGSGERL